MMEFYILTNGIWFDLLFATVEVLVVVSLAIVGCMFIDGELIRFVIETK